MCVKEEEKYIKCQRILPFVQGRGTLQIMTIIYNMQSRVQKEEKFYDG